ncbi:MAG: nucleotide exchange factor GrpE [Pseudomonadota bacterium]|nr:nucleotide exchange factor GrpE [Pseudomonadota bacterium]
MEDSKNPDSEKILSQNEQLEEDNEIGIDHREEENLEFSDNQDIESEEPTVDSLLEEVDALKDRLMRALADSENLRKRAERDRKDAEVYGGTRLARDLLSVYDNMSRALENIDNELREQSIALVEGIELTQRELLTVFSKHKINQILPKEGDKFDPKFHQAMFEAPIPGTKKGTVIQVMTNGFKIGERLLRAAQVGVSSNNEEAEVEEDLEESVEQKE